MDNKIDWAAVKTEYITSNISQAKLAEKYKITLSYLKKKAQKEKWTADKKQYSQTVVQKVVQKRANKTAANIAKELKILDQLTDTLESIVKDPAQFFRHIIQTKIKDSSGELWDAEERIFEKADTKAILDVAKALEKIIELKKSAQLALTPYQEEQIMLAKKKLELEEAKAKAENYDDDEELGVVMLAPILPAIEPPIETTGEIIEGELNE